MKKHLLIMLLWGIATCLSVAQAQQRTIRGTVTAADDGSPLPGAVVMLKDQSQGTLTKEDGKYELAVPDTSSVIVASFVGMATQEIRVGQRTTIDIAMQSASLEEVILVGYGTQKRSQITGSVSTVTASEITSMPTLRIEQALQGRAAGVSVTQNSGSPGSALTVRIRGIGTTGSSDPLYVVDGMLVNGLDFLNPNDIESISILKDAASAAIYGTNGANGVVLITTKKGKKDQPAVVSYEGYYGIQRPWKKMNLLNAREYAILSNEAHIAAGITPLPEFANPDALGEGTDWQDAIFEAAPIQNHQVSVTGGSSKATYALTANQFDQKGIVGGDKSAFSRTTVRLNNTFDVTNRLVLGNNIGFTHLQRTAMPENNEFTTPLIRALNMDPVTPIYKPDGTFAFSEYSDTDIRNPVNQIALASDRWRSDRLVGNIYGEYTILEGLKFRSAANLDMTYATQDIFTPSYNLGSANEQNPLNSVSKQFMKWRTWLVENTLTYHKVFGDKHDLTLLAGTMAQSFRFENLGGSKADLPTNDPNAAYINLAEDRLSMAVYGGANESSLRSYLGRVNYEFYGKYLASATVRVDGSSRFGANNRYAAFPSLSLGWLITEEKFMERFSDLNLLKLRASLGQNGNQEIGLYGFTSTVTNGLTYTFGPNEIITNGSAPIVASNPDLKWETSTQFDLGIDAGLWGDKLTFTADYYIKTTSNMLVVVPIPTHVGAAPPIVNAGSVRNRGLELAAQYRGFGKKFTYNIGGNIAFLNNEVISLGNGGEPISTGFLQSANGNIARTEVGHPIASFYGYQTDGIFQNAEEVAAGNQPNASPGDIRFRDLNNDGVIDFNDQTFIGNPTPDFTYGLTANATYGDFDFTMFIQGVHGNDIFSGITRYDFSYVNVPVSRLDRWTGEGTSEDEPRVVIGDPNQNARVSDRFVEKGSYLRLKNVQIGYNLPMKALDMLNVSKVRFYVAAQNLYTLTNYSGLDPEIGNRGSLEIGIDRGFYPQARTILGGINFTF